MKSIREAEGKFIVFLYELLAIPDISLISLQNTKLKYDIKYDVYYQSLNYTRKAIRNTQINILENKVCINNYYYYIFYKYKKLTISTSDLVDLCIGIPLIQVLENQENALIEEAAFAAFSDALTSNQGNKP